MNSIVPHQPQAIATRPSNPMVPANMGDAIRLADMMSKSKMMPPHLQGDPCSCMMVIDQATRWSMSPFSLALCHSNIKGKSFYEGKSIAAGVASSGYIVSEFDYDYTGDPKKPETLEVICSAVRASDGKRKEIRLAWKDAKTTNEWWVKQPEQQLSYAAARTWARRWTPGAILGVYAPEEFAQAQAEAFTGATIEADAEPVTAIAAPASEAPKKRTWKDLLDEIEAELKGAHTTDAVDMIIASERVQKALDGATNGTRTRLDAIIKAATDRTTDDFPGDIPAADTADVDADARR